MVGDTQQPGKRPSQEGGAIVTRAGITMLGAIFGGSIVFGNELLIARNFGAEIYGLYALGMAFARIGETLALFGLTYAVLHFLPLHASKKDENRVFVVILASLLLPIIHGCLLVVAIWLAAPWLASHVFEKPEALPYIRMLAFAIPLLNVSEVCGMATRALGYAVYYVVIRYLVPPISFLLLLAAIALNDADPLWITGAFGLAYALAAIGGVVILTRLLGSGIWRQRRHLPIASLYRYSFPALINNALYMTIGWTGILVLSVFAPAQDVGMYRACMQFVLLFEMIQTGFIAATAYRYPVLAQEKKWSELDNTYGIALRWVVLLAVPSFVVVAFNSGDLLAIIHPAFAAGAVALAVRAGAALLESWGGGAGVMLLVTNRQWLETINALVATLVVVSMTVALVPGFGVAGAAIASLMAALFLNGLRAVEVWLIMGARSLQTSFGLIMLASIAVAGCIQIGAEVSGAGSGSGFLQMALRIGLTGCALAAALWFCALTKEEKTAIRGIAMLRSAPTSGQ